VIGRYDLSSPDINLSTHDTKDPETLL
jgi:hypothetical protein